MGHSARYAAGYYDNIVKKGEVTYGTDVPTYSEKNTLVVHGWIKDETRIPDSKETCIDSKNIIFG